MKAKGNVNRAPAPRAAALKGGDPPVPRKISSHMPYCAEGKHVL